VSLRARVQGVEGKVIHRLEESEIDGIFRSDLVVNVHEHKYNMPFKRQFKQASSIFTAWHSELLISSPLF